MMKANQCNVSTELHVLNYFQKKLKKKISHAIARCFLLIVKIICFSRNILLCLIKIQVEGHCERSDVGSAQRR
jgi:hypothetical protein